MRSIRNSGCLEQNSVTTLHSNHRSIILNVVIQVWSLHPSQPPIHCHQRRMSVLRQHCPLAWHTKLDRQRSQSGVHQPLLGAVRAGGCQAQLDLGISPTVGWTIESGQQDHHYVLEVHV
jgi:hypothetical protein